MSPEAIQPLSSRGEDARSSAREARRLVARKLTELLLALADADEAQRRETLVDRLELIDLSVLGAGDGEAEVIRGLVESPLYGWVICGYVSGDGDGRLLGRISEILDELAPRERRAPRL